MVNDPDHAIAWSAGTRDDLRMRLTDYEDSVDIDDRPPAGPSTGLVSLGFLLAALRRTAKFWCALAVVGLLGGAAYAVAVPPVHTAAVSVLLVDDPNQLPNEEVLTDIVLAESLPVATAVVHQLGLPQTPVAFIGTYSVTDTTTRVLTISAKGKSDDQAVRIASALATQFLDFRASYELKQQLEAEAQLNQQVTQAQQKLNSLNKQIQTVSAEPSSSAQQSQLSSLRTQATAATSNQVGVQQYVTTTLAQDQTTTQAMIRGSQVLDPSTAGKRSRVKTLAIYTVMGLLAGLALGMVIVLVGAITSNRLRRRDDIAYAFGAPVTLSVGRLRQGRFGLGSRGRRGSRRRDMERVVEHLRNAAPGSSGGPVGLAVVAVDDVPTVASVVFDLAVSKARAGARLVVADLCDGAPAARLLGVTDSGISKVSVAGATVIVVVPVGGGVTAIGPLKGHASPQGGAQPDAVLASACGGADLVLSLVRLDPARGADHLATWATEAVAVVTAGRSSAVRIHAVGELVRLSGARLGSVIVVGADKSDESIGMTSAAVLGACGDRGPGPLSTLGGTHHEDRRRAQPLPLSDTER
jgi:capsular polysaccharide biosynthesis protein